MPFRLTRYALGCIALLLVVTGPLQAQGDPQRDGIWFSAGVGQGSLHCDHCLSQVSGLSGQLAVGATLNGHWLIGVGANGWVKSEGGETLSMRTVTAQARYYPTADTRFFLSGGLGVASLDLGPAQYGARTGTGAGALLGAGYDIRFSHATSLTVFCNGVAGNFDGGGARFGQIGLSLTRY